MLDVFVQVQELKRQRLARGQAVHPQVGNVAHHHHQRQVTLGQVLQVANGLRHGGTQTFAARLVFDQQHAAPEQVDKALGAAVLFDVQLKGGDSFVGDAKDLKEFDPKGLGFAVFVAGIGPGFAEKQCPGFDFVPIKTH
jgi:hypothetical protein